MASPFTVTVRTGTVEPTGVAVAVDEVRTSAVAGSGTHATWNWSGVWPAVTAVGAGATRTVKWARDAAL